MDLALHTRFGSPYTPSVKPKLATLNLHPKPQTLIKVTVLIKSGPGADSSRTTTYCCATVSALIDLVLRSL